MNPIEKCYFNADARLLRASRGGRSWRRVSSLKIGSRSVTPRMEQATCQTDGRTHAPAIASDAGVAGSIVLHATQYEEGRIVGDPWQGRAGRVKELSLVSHKLKLVPPHRKLATGQPYTARVICGILFTVHLTNAHIAAEAAAGQESRDNARD